MAKLNAAPLSTIVTALARHAGLRHMVETGTSHKASSALWGATNFEKVTTVEVLPEYVEAARALLAPYPNVECRLGDSAEMLRSLAPTLEEPAFFWLDAHRGGGYHGTDDFCPLIAELDAIALSEHDHLVFIDDAHGFLAPMPPPFDHTAWPTLVEVIEAVNQRHRHHCVVFNNVIMCAPESLREQLDRSVIASQEHGAMIYKGLKR